MYWHLREFDPIDMVEDLDLDEKYRKKQKMEALMQKFRDLPESEQIRKFIQFERLNYKTQLYNKSRKIDSILKQLNSGGQIVEKDDDGQELMGFTQEGKKKIMYGPKIQLQKEIVQAEDDQQNMQLQSLIERSGSLFQASGMNQLGQDSILSLQQPLYGGHGATHDFARADDLMESIQQLSP